METTVNRKELKNSLLGSGHFVLTISRSCLLLASQGASIKLELRLPCVPTGIGVSSVLVSARTLGRLLNSLTPEQVTLELGQDCLCVETANAFFELTAKEHPITEYALPHEACSVSAVALLEAISQLRSVAKKAKLRNRDLTFGLSEDCLTVCTVGGESASRIATSNEQSSPTRWRLAKSDVSKVTRLLRKPAKSREEISIHCDEEALTLSADTWSVSLTEASDSPPPCVVPSYGMQVACSDLRRALAHVNATGASEVKLYSRGRALTLSAPGVQSVTRCAGKISATWDCRLLLGYVTNTSGTVTVNEHDAFTKNSSLVNQPRKDSPCSQAQVQEIVTV